MAITDGGFAQWVNQADVSPERLSVQQEAILQAAFHFRGQVGDDSYTKRLLSHFLLHCDSKLKVAQIARLVGIDRRTTEGGRARARMRWHGEQPAASTFRLT